MTERGLECGDNSATGGTHTASPSWRENPSRSSPRPAAGQGQEVAVALLVSHVPPGVSCPLPYLTDEVDAEEDLPRGLEGAAAWLLAVELTSTTGQDEEATDDGDGPGVHPHLRRGHRHPPGPPRLGWGGRGSWNGWSHLQPVAVVDMATNMGGIGGHSKLQGSPQGKPAALHAERHEAGAEHGHPHVHIQVGNRDVWLPGGGGSSSP